MLLSLECYPLDWFSLCVFDCCKYHCHLLRITLASLPYLSPLMSCLIGEYCWSPILELMWLALLCFWCSLRMELLWLLILDVAVFTDACYCSLYIKITHRIYVLQSSYFCFLWQGFVAIGVIDDGNFKTVMYSSF